MITLTGFSEEIKKLSKEDLQYLSKDELIETVLYTQDKYIDAIKSYMAMKGISDTQDIIINKLEKSLKHTNIPKFGVGLGILAGLDQDLEADVYTGIRMRFYFWDARFSFDPELYVKIYDRLGGGLGLGFSINF